MEECIARSHLNSGVELGLFRSEKFDHWTMNASKTLGTAALLARLRLPALDSAQALRNGGGHGAAEFVLGAVQRVARCFLARLSFICRPPARLASFS